MTKTTNTKRLAPVGASLFVLIAYSKSATTIQYTLFVLQIFNSLFNTSKKLNGCPKTKLEHIAD